MAKLDGEAGEALYKLQTTVQAAEVEVEEAVAEAENPPDLERTFLATTGKVGLSISDRAALGLWQEIASQNARRDLERMKPREVLNAYTRALAKGPTPDAAIKIRVIEDALARGWQGQPTDDPAETAAAFALSRKIAEVRAARRPASVARWQAARHEAGRAATRARDQYKIDLESRRRGERPETGRDAARPVLVWVRAGAAPDGRLVCPTPHREQARVVEALDTRRGQALEFLLRWAKKTAKSWTAAVVIRWILLADPLERQSRLITVSSWDEDQTGIIGALVKEGIERDQWARSGSKITRSEIVYTEPMRDPKTGGESANDHRVLFLPRDYRGNTGLEVHVNVKDELWTAPDHAHDEALIISPTRPYELQPEPVLY